MPTTAGSSPGRSEPAARSKAAKGISAVVIPGLQDNDVRTADQVHKAMFLVDPAGHRARRKAVLEQFRLADSPIVRARDVVDQAVDPFQELPICHLPIGVVLPRFLGEDNSHRMRSWASTSPRRACSTLSISRRAFVGERSR